MEIKNKNKALRLTSHSVRPCFKNVIWKPGEQEKLLSAQTNSQLPSPAPQTSIYHFFSKAFLLPVPAPCAGLCAWTPRPSPSQHPSQVHLSSSLTTRKHAYLSTGRYYRACGGGVWNHRFWGAEMGKGRKHLSGHSHVQLYFNTSRSIGKRFGDTHTGVCQQRAQSMCSNYTASGLSKARPPSSQGLENWENP